MKSTHSSLCLFGVALVACAAPTKEPARYSLSISAVDDRGSALRDIPIHIGETDIGMTDGNGVLRAEVNASDGDRYPLVAPCPEAHEPLQMPDEVVFLDTRGLGGEKNATLEIRVVCKRQSRIAAVLVHAAGLEGMPILIDGIKKATTGPGGIAHLRLEGASSSQFEIALDTRDKPSLVPQNPRKEVQLGDEDGLFVFEPAFSEAESRRPAKSKRRRRRRAQETPEAAKPRRPVKID